MKLKTSFTLAVAAMAICSVFNVSRADIQFGENASAPMEPLSLWYRQPAKEWVEALSVGNGRLGAMVFGGVTQERLQLNEDTL
jgi:hypothetical protein